MYLAAMSWMTHTETQANKILAADLFDNVSQSVMATMTTTLFQTNHAGIQIDFVVHHEDFFRPDIVVGTDGLDCPAAFVHVGLGFQQSVIDTVSDQPRSITVVFTISAEGRPIIGCKPIQKPEPGIMPGFGII
jgi:hypothetical protein